MDASETLEYVRTRASHEITLETGTRYTIILPDLMRLMSFGTIPLPVLKMADENGNGQEPTPEMREEQREAMRSMYAYNDQVLADGIVAIEGEPVTMTPEAVRFITDDEREELLEYLKREKELPKAGAPL